MHSGRIGGATEAAIARVGRADIKEARDWSSEAVDVYIRPQGKGKGVSRALVRQISF